MARPFQEGSWSVLERTLCRIQRPAFGGIIPQPREGLLGQTKGVQIAFAPFYDMTHEFRPTGGDYEYFCIYCLGRTTEADYHRLIEGEVNTIELRDAKP